MSYDLAVFDPAAAPASVAEFMGWFRQQTTWEEPHDYNDPEAPSPPLQAWFRDMIVRYPPMNGPLASDDPDDPCVSDYSLGRSLVYIAFAWSEAEGAHEHARTLAARHGVGFFDVSGSGGPLVWLPSAGTLHPMP